MSYELVIATSPQVYDFVDRDIKNELIFLAIFSFFLIAFFCQQRMQAGKKADAHHEGDMVVERWIR